MVQSSVHPGSSRFGVIPSEVLSLLFSVAGQVPSRLPPALYPLVILTRLFVLVQREQTIPHVLAVARQLYLVGFLRLATAICFAWFSRQVVFGLETTSSADFSMAALRRVLFFFHTCAVAGIDEGLLLSFISYRPFTLEKMTPGTPSVPVTVALPTRRTVFAAAGYMLLLGHSVCVLLPGHGTDITPTDVYVSTALFLAVGCCDLGVFYSARPGVSRGFPSSRSRRNNTVACRRKAFQHRKGSSYASIAPACFSSQHRHL